MGRRLMFIELVESTPTVPTRDEFFGRPAVAAYPAAEAVEVGAHHSFASGGLVTLTFTTVCMAGDERTVVDAVCRAITGSLIGKITYG